MLKCRLVKFCLVFVSVLFIVAACSGSSDEKLVQQKCGDPSTKCHAVRVALNQRQYEEMWKGTVERMKKIGMKTTEEQDARIVKWLTENQGVR